MLKLHNGTCTLASSDPTSEVIDRANQLLKIGLGIYEVYSNNCEDFGFYCKTSYAFDGRVGGSTKHIICLINLVIGFILSLALSKFICWPVLAFVLAPLYHFSVLYAIELHYLHEGVKKVCVNKKVCVKKKYT